MKRVTGIGGGFCPDPVPSDSRLFKHLMDDEGFRRFVTDTVFGLTYEARA